MIAKIYHNNRCGKSRETLRLIREKNIEPQIIEYLNAPLNVTELTELSKKLGVNISSMVRKKEKIFKELDLKNKSDIEITKAIEENPILLERPIVVTRKGAKICRPPELVEDIL